MPEKNFEQQMEDILGKLQMQPDEKVWTQVEKRINQKSDRKRPAFLIPLLLLLLAGGGLFYFQSSDNDNKGEVKQLAEKKTVFVPKDSTRSQNILVVPNEIVEKTSTRKNEDEASEKTLITKKSLSIPENSKELFVKERKATPSAKINSIPIKENKSNVAANADDSKRIDDIRLKAEEGKPSVTKETNNQDRATDQVEFSQKNTGEKNSENKILPERKESEAALQNVIKVRKPKWEKGFVAAAGTVAYSDKLNVFNFLGAGQKSANVAFGSSASPSGNITYTSYAQHAKSGFQYSAGFFVQRNFKKIAVGAAVAFENVRFENYQTIKTEVYTTINNTNQLQSAGAFYSSGTKLFRLSGLSLGLNVSGNIAEGNNKSLRWEIGLPQQLLFNRSTSQMVNSSNNFSTASLQQDKIIWQSGVDVGMNLTTGKKFKFNAGPYFQINLNSIKTNIDQPVHLYKAGIRLKYFLH